MASTSRPGAVSRSEEAQEPASTSGSHHTNSNGPANSNSNSNPTSSSTTRSTTSAAAAAAAAIRSAELDAGSHAKTWVGAFERVLGDQAEALSQERRQRQQQQERLQAQQAAKRTQLQQQHQAQAHAQQQQGQSQGGTAATESGGNTSGVTPRGSSVPRPSAHRREPSGAELPLPSHFLVEGSGAAARPFRSEQRPAAGVGGGGVPGSRASSVHSSASWRPSGALEQPHESGGANHSDTGAGAGVFLLPSSALASHTHSEAGTESSDRSALQTGSVSGSTGGAAAGGSHVARRARKLLCADPACQEGGASGVGLDSLDAADASGSGPQVKSTGPSLVALLGPPGVGLEELYLNHAPGLQKLTLSNLTPARVKVRLDSDLGDAISFMRIQSASEQEQDLDRVAWPTNSVAWARGDGLSPDRLRDLRHITASLEEVTSIAIEGSSTLTLLCLFRPKRWQRSFEDKHKQQQKQQQRRSARFAAPSPRSEPEENNWHHQNQKGSNTSHSSASSQASYQSSPRTTVTDGRSPQLEGRESPSLAQFGAKKRPEVQGAAEQQQQQQQPEVPHLNHRSVARGTLQLRVSRAQDDVLALPQEEDEQSLAIPFRSSFCKPQINVMAHSDTPSPQYMLSAGESTSTLVFDFGEIIVGQHQEKSICIRNISQIESCWQARLEEADNPLPHSAISLVQSQAASKRYDMINERPESVFCPYWLSPFQAEVLTLKLDAAHACRELEQVITITNLHDTTNNFRIVVKANILGLTPPTSSLLVTPSDALDFGDCCGGQWTRQILVLRNDEDFPVELTFSASKGAEVTFEVAKVIVESGPPGETSEDSLFSSASSSAASHASEALQSRSASASSSAEHIAKPCTQPEPLDEEARTPALESMRTPISRAQHRSDMEPPPFSLGSSAAPDPSLPTLNEADLADEDDTDAYSNASQAGSRPASPGGSHSGNRSSSASTGPSAHSVAMAALADRLGRQSFGSSQADSHAAPGRVGAEAAAGRDSDQDMHSVVSEVTTTSHDSKRSVFAASHSQSGVSAALLSGSARGPHPLSGLRNVDFAPTHRLEEFHLNPGVETRILVSYRPPKGKPDETFSKGRLREMDFDVFIDSARWRGSSTRSRGAKSRRFVPCKVRTCTSFVTVSPKLIDFGETNVGARKSATVSVTNHSVLTARVDVRFVSKVLSMYRDEVPIPPLQTVDLKVDFFPRRINDSYRKQITVTNLLNRDDDQIFEVRSKNVDKQRITFHTIFYRILTFSGANFIDFGDVNINSTRVRSFSIVNTSHAPLSLEVTAAHAEDLTLYVKNEEEQPKSGSSNGATTTRAGQRYAEMEVLERTSAAESNRHAGSKKGNGLKERFLETISMDSPTTVRNENATWRLAQKQAQTKKRVREDKSTTEEKAKSKASGKPKPAVNLVSALKKGGKGKITLRYDSGVTFKDRKALAPFEFLDLASGPPVDAVRISPKSKMWQQLEYAASHGRLGVTHSAEQVPSEGSGSKAPAAQDTSSTKPAPAKKARAPALTGKRPTPRWLADSADVSKLSPDELTAAMESQQSSLHTFFLDDPEAEERQVRTEINLQRRLSALISQRLLISAELLQLAPGEEKQVIALYTPNASTRPHVQGNARKQDSRIFLRLVDFDESLVSSYPDLMPLAKLDKEELPVRDLMIKSTTCRSIMELGQTHINFGHMDKGETKNRKIVIQNRSEWALRYCIRKSGSIASGDIKIPIGRYGIIPGYGKREVDFGFSPSMSGQFQEKLVIENVADQDNDQTLVLKANVRKLPNFNVEPSMIAVGDFHVGQMSAVESFTVTNISNKTRTFVVDLDRSELQKHLAIIEVLIASADESGGRGALTQAEEEELEHISQKLKIATRKGQADKIKKYESRLRDLGVSPSTAIAEPGSADGEGESPADKEKQVSAPEPATSTTAVEPEKAASSTSDLKRSATSITFSLEAGRSRRMTLQLRLRSTATALDEAAAHHHRSRAPETVDEVVLKLQVHEAKNADETKTVLVRGQAHIDRAKEAAMALEREAKGAAEREREQRQEDDALAKLHIFSACD